MRLSKDEYGKAVKCLKRYNYNKITIFNITADIINISSVNIDGMPKSKYSISDTVSDTIIKLEENEELQEITKDFKAVNQAILLIDKDSKIIFEELYKKEKSMWEIIDAYGFSERTFRRRKRELIYAVHNELNKLEKNKLA